MTEFGSYLMYHIKQFSYDLMIFEASKSELNNFFFISSELSQGVGLNDNIPRLEL